jgi:pilus assembly protein Flp/PilA
LINARRKVPGIWNVPGICPAFSQQQDEVVEMKKFIVAFIKDEEGLTMVEYAIAGALVAAGAVGAFTTLGNNIVTKITALAADVLNAPAS